MKPNAMTSAHGQIAQVIMLYFMSFAVFRLKNRFRD
jgi:hypothetical protein